MSEQNKEIRVMFVIANFYCKENTSYLQYYIDNIKKFYENSFILIVDNNSNDFDDFKNELIKYKNIDIITNNSDCKFELGAYKYGIKYILDNELINKFDYFVFSQENFVLKNKYDFKNLEDNKVLACPINNWHEQDELFHHSLTKSVLNNLNVPFNELKLCWCCTFILHSSVVNQFNEIVKDINITAKKESECTERFLSGILFKLNNNNNFSIDGNLQNVDYDPYYVDVINCNTKHYFVKKYQRRRV
jgi:hypothetical protein